MNKPQIVFSHLLFNSATAFILVDGRQYSYGSIVKKFPNEFEFWEEDFWKERKPEIQWPTAEESIDEYKKQCAKAGRAVINPQIIYAG